LTDIAPRFAGTRAEKVAVNYIENEFRSYGLKAWVENFYIAESYSVERASLSVTAPERLRLNFVPILYSPSADNVAGGLSQFGSLPKDYSRLSDTFVLVNRENLVDLLEVVGTKNPLAVLTYYEGFPQYSETFRQVLRFPILWISSDDAHRLMDLLKFGEVNLELSFVASYGGSTSHNVLAVIPGKSDETIIICAHHDSMLTPGAVDDASGVAAILDIARLLSNEKFSRTIMFASFGAEELGLLGSSNFVDTHPTDDIVGVIAIDSIAPGPADGLRAGLRDSGLATTERLDLHVKLVASKIGLRVRDESVGTIRGYSDYASFTRKGIPGTWIYWVNFKGREAIWPVHTLADNLDAIDAAKIEQVTALGVELLRDLAGSTEPPLALAFFTLFGAGVIVLSFVASSFTHYKKKRSWKRSLLIFISPAVLAILFAYILLIA
jgi:aminopeptidase YwaD